MGVGLPEATPRLCPSRPRAGQGVGQGWEQKGVLRISGYKNPQHRLIVRKKDLAQRRQGRKGEKENSHRWGQMGTNGVLRIFEYKNSQHRCSSPNSAFQARIRR